MIFRPFREVAILQEVFIVCRVLKLRDVVIKMK